MTVHASAAKSEGFETVAPQLAYPVIVEEGLIDRVGEIAERVAPAHSYAIITDENVLSLYAARVRASFNSPRVTLLHMPPGETHKVVSVWWELSEEMLRHHLGRDSTVIALGGGIVGDVAGFVAATYMRGIPCIQVPTSLVAMVDASIGGKTGVNTMSGKNLLGAFHQPRAVLADPAALRTLPLPELRGGLAEVIKHGVIADADYFARVEAGITSILESHGASEETRGIVRGSVEIKARVVAEDERESGIRKILNFGHTLGHAIEALGEYRLLHGEAVAIGMVLEADAAERAGIAQLGTATRIKELLERAGLPTQRPEGLSPEGILAAAESDKKARGGEIELALPIRIGEMAGAGTGWGVRVPRELLLDAMR